MPLLNQDTDDEVDSAGSDSDGAAEEAFPHQPQESLEPQKQTTDEGQGDDKMHDEKEDVKLDVVMRQSADTWGLSAAKAKVWLGDTTFKYLPSIQYKDFYNILFKWLDDYIFHYSTARKGIMKSQARYKL